MKSSHNISVGKKVHSAHVSAEYPRWELFDSGEDILDHHGHFFDDMNTEEEKQKEDSNGDYISQREKERIEKKAFDRGFEEGEKQGYSKGSQETREQLGPTAQFIEKLIDELKQEKESFYHENELYIVKLAIEIARKIIHKELTQKPDILLYVVREALSRITNNGRILIRAHPDDIQLLKKNENFTETQLAAFEHVDFVSSEKIERGGCVIESDSGIIDAQLDVQLEQIEQSLLEGMNA